MIHEIHLQTKRRDEMLDITAQVEEVLENVQEGQVVVYCPHTTAGITINENADPDVTKRFPSKVGRDISMEYGRRPPF